ncbi:hypothetical protein ACR0ST_07380 [Aliidiomarina sp. Khilg15.8]
MTTSTGFHFRLSSLAAATFLLSACSSTPDAPEDLAQIDTDGSLLIIEGYINQATVDRIRQLSTDHEFSRLRVNSPGGDPLANIQLGGWIHRRQLDIEIQEQCLHSCANYLFTAAKRKTIYPGAVVAWSGGALEESWTQQWQNYLIPGVRHVVEQYLDRFLRREIRFFERVGVDQRITVYGQDEEHGCMSDDMQGFYYSVPDLLSMGVYDVNTPGRNWNEAFADYGEQFCQVELGSQSDRIIL